MKIKCMEIMDRRSNSLPKSYTRNKIMEQERYIERLKTEKERLFLEIILKEKHSRDLQMQTDERQTQLARVQHYLQKELLSRSASETHKLDLLAEISHLKIKLSRCEQQLADLNQQLHTCELVKDEMRAKLSQRLNEINDLKRRLNSYETTTGEDEYECRLERAFKDDEIDRLKRSIEQLVNSNQSKDKQIEQLRQQLETKLPPPGATSTPVQLSNNKQLLSTETLNDTPPSTICTSPHSNNNTLKTPNSKRPYGTFISNNNKTTSLNRNAVTSAYHTLSSIGKNFFKGRDRNSNWNSAPSLARSDEEAVKDEMAMEYRMLIERQQQSRQINNCNNNNTNNNNSGGSNNDKKIMTIRNLFRRMRRTSSQDLVDNEIHSSEFQRNSILRSTAGPRLGWSSYEEAPFHHWDCDRVCAWLQTIGLGQYVFACKRQSHNGLWFLNASYVDLEKDLGIKNHLHRKKIILAVTAPDNEAPNLNRFDHHCVCRWLDDIGLPQYKDTFTESRIDGRLLNQLTVDDLLFLKVSSALHHASISRAIQLLRLHNFDTSFIIRRPMPSAVQPVLYWSNHRLMDWLRSIDLAEYTANLRGSGIHGALLLLEPRFSAEQLAAILSIPNQKTLLRRHLTTHFINLIGNRVQAAKRQAESQVNYMPLTNSLKVKAKKNFFGQKRLYENNGDEILVCPIQDKQLIEIQHLSDDINHLTNRLSNDTFLEKILTSNV